jgi:hypothetical protein
MTSQKSLSRQHSSSDTNDSIASSYYPPQQRHQHNFPQPNDQITKLQQQNFHRLLSNAESAPLNNTNHLSEDTLEDNDHFDQQRTMLNHRRQVLLNALQSIDKQIEELDLE